jgi:signal transduction histidine kinase
MSRSLKIVSRRRHPEPRGSEGSTSGAISMKISPPSSESQVIREADFDISSPFGLSSTPHPGLNPSGSKTSLLPSTSRLWRETKGRLEENLGRRQARKEQTAKEEKKERMVLEAINKLMVTISHYLSNPLTILLGRIELLSNAAENGGMSKEDVKKFTDSCKREIHKIDSIIKVFQNLCEVRYKTYPPGVKMLDVENEIRNRLKEVEAFDIIKLR